MTEINQQRVTMLLKKPNPLFEKWLMEWREEAKRKGSKAERTINVALSNLKKYKLPLESGQECKILKGFGNKLCQMLDKKLKDHLKSNSLNIDLIENDCDNMVKGNLNNTQQEIKKTSNRNESRPKQYIPQKGSGAYAILLVLYEHNLHTNATCTKSEITAKAKKYSQLCVWPSMRTLLKKELVNKSASEFFCLTSKGSELASQLWQSKDENNDGTIKNSEVIEPAINSQTIVHKDELLRPQVTNSNNYNNTGMVKSNDVNTIGPKKDMANNTFAELPSNLNKGKALKRHASASSVSCQNKPQSKTLKKYASSSVASSQNSTEDECSIFEPETFDIILYIDTQETAGSTTNIKQDPLLSEINGLTILYEVKSLKVGDYIWICRHRTSKKELVLPYVIERKRLDDFARSIKDGRYHEQKFRLKKSGIQNITYLIENYNNKHIGLPMTSLHQAAANTAIQDEFYIKFTSNIRHTAKYLANFTRLLQTNFKSKTLISCPKENLADINITDDLMSLMTFKEFNQSSAKNKPMKVTDLFVKMLIQIKGLSVDKALAIVQKYPTPSLLRKAYSENSRSAGEKLLASVQSGKLHKPLGPVLSKVVYDLFTTQAFQ